MTADEFRKLALSFPESMEASHMNHPDFRVRGKIFATLGYAGDGSAMVKLTPLQQEEFIASEPAMFQPVPGGWGRQGATHVILASATEHALRRALGAAWRNAAPKELVKEFKDE